MRSFAKTSAAPLIALALLAIAPDARAGTIDRGIVPGTLTRRFSVPVIDSVLGPAGGRSYARAADLLPESGSTPRRLWWTRAPGESRWTLVNAKASPYYPWSLAPDPGRPDTVYGADPVGTVFRSLDGGATWETRGMVPGGNVQQLLLVGTTLLAVGEPRFCAPCRSEDGGQSWEKSTPQIFGLLSSGGDPGIVYMFSAQAIYRSTDSGRTFNDVSPAPSEGASALAVASDPDVVYALSPQPAPAFLSRTTDGGASWTRLAAPEAGLSWTGLAVDPASALHLAVLGGASDAAALRRVFESFDGGLTWKVRPGALNATALRLSGETVQAFGRRGLFESAGPDASWVSDDRGIVADSRLLLAGSRSGGLLYLTNPESGGVWSSSDAGLTWEGRSARPGLQALAVDPLDSGKLVGIDRELASLSWSDDGGRTWTSRLGPRKRGDSLPILTVAFDPHRRNVLYASTLEDAWRSADRGATWSRFTGSLRAGTDCTTFFCYKIRDVESVLPDPLVPNRFYVVAHTYDTFRTDNGGATWKRVTGPELAASDSPRMLPDPRVKDHLYWGVRVEAKIFESLSAGNPPWRTVLRTGSFSPLPDTWFTFDPQGRLVVQTQESPATILRRLADTANADWESFRAVLPVEGAQLLEPLVPLPGGGTRMFLLVPGLGLFRADLPAAG